MSALDVGIDVCDPRTGAAERVLLAPTLATLTSHAARLRDAQRCWADRGADGRAEVLLRWRAELERSGDQVVDALIRDTGRRTESRLELESILGMLDRWAAQAPAMLAAGQPAPASLPGKVVGSSARAYGLVGVISPWNFPLLLGLIDTIPALVAGSAVLLKPSEVTPRFIEPLMATVTAVPELAEVLHIVEGAGEVGSAMIGLVDCVAFTGSVPTGRLVGRAAAEAFIPAFLELGGKDPALVLAGADLDRASSAVLWGGTANAGQSCLSIERVYVAKEIFANFVDQLVVKADKVGLAWPTLDDGELGPLIDRNQAVVIERHLADAVAKGATIRCGGRIERHGGGYWCRPTVLTGVDHSMLIMTEETFGPILPVMSCSTVAEGIRLANDSNYGLSAAVLAGSEAQALEIAAQLEAGAISIDDAGLGAFVFDGEKDAFKSSGLGGSRTGPASLRRFLRRQTFIINHSPHRNPWWWDDQELRSTN